MRLTILALLFSIITLYCFGQEQPIIDKYKIDSGYFTSFDQHKIYYEVRGKGDPVVLIHGFIVNGESWKRTALYRDLLNSGYSVITLDLRGNGKSDKPHTPEAYSNDAESKDIMGLLDHLGIKKYKTVGYSRGSILVSRLMVLDPRVSVAVLGGMGADFTNPDWPRRIMFYEALMGKPVKELEGMVKYVRESGLDSLALAYLQKEQPSSSPAELKKMEIPVLVIKGGQDPDNGSGEELAKMMNQATYVTVPGTHNDVYKTQAFSDEVLKFFKEKSK